MTLAMLGLAGLLLLVKLPRARQSTLWGPGLWGLVALVALTLSTLSRDVAGTQSSVMTFLAASVTICPAVSVLGAKRPQDRAWHFVVAALYLVLVLPVAHTLVVGRTEQIELHVVRRVFLAILLVIGMANYLGTRYWFCALLYVLGQAVLFGPVMLPTASWSLAGYPNSGSLLIAASVSLACLGIPRRRHASGGLTREWLDFRDAFGAAWGLRVVERMNRASQKLDWGVRLRWQGFVNHNGIQSDPAAGSAAERSFRMLLRRFVSTNDRIQLRERS